MATCQNHYHITPSAPCRSTLIDCTVLLASRRHSHHNCFTQAQTSCRTPTTNWQLSDKFSSLSTLVDLANDSCFFDVTSAAPINVSITAMCPAPNWRFTDFWLPPASNCQLFWLLQRPAVLGSTSWRSVNNSSKFYFLQTVQISTRQLAKNSISAFRRALTLNSWRPASLC